MVAALLHDIGKGGLTEHSVARRADRPGDRHPDGLRRAHGRPGRHPGALAPAARRDRDHPRPRRPGHRAACWSTGWAARRRSSLLRALTEADARATAPKAWSTWRAGLIATSSRRRAAASLAGRAAPTCRRRSRTRSRSRAPSARAGPAIDGRSPATTAPGSPCIAPDRVGLLADVAALVRAAARAGAGRAGLGARATYAVSVWEVAEEHLDPAVLRQRFDAIVAGRVDPSARLRRAPTSGSPRPSVVRPEASAHATVSRCGRPTGPVCSTWSAPPSPPRTSRCAPPTSTRSGPQAVDVFYVQESGGRRPRRPARRRGRPRRPHGHSEPADAARGSP